MRTLNKPTDNVLDVFSKCIENYRDEDLKKRLESCKPNIKHITEIFEAKASIACTHLITSHDTVAGIVTNTEMSNVYTDKMVNKKSPGRVYYDKYISAPKNGVCPLCGLRLASTLDHYLPKMKYPSLAVTPSNLVPACRDCNTLKLDEDFSKSSEETIHPYFDNIEKERWLEAIIMKDEEPVVTYYVSKPEQWDESLFERVTNHFEVFGLNRLYSVHAAEEFTSIKHKLLKLYQRLGPDGVREQIKEDMESCESVHLNSWKSALYRALYTSEWFYEEWLKRQFKE